MDCMFRMTKMWSPVLDVRAQSIESRPPFQSHPRSCPFFGLRSCGFCRSFRTASICLAANFSHFHFSFIKQPARAAGGAHRNRRAHIAQRSNPLFRARWWALWWVMEKIYIFVYLFIYSWQRPPSNRTRVRSFTGSRACCGALWSASVRLTWCCREGFLPLDHISL